MEITFFGHSTGVQRMENMVGEKPNARDCRDLPVFRRCAVLKESLKKTFHTHYKVCQQNRFFAKIASDWRPLLVFLLNLKAGNKFEF